jgi:uncharacterized membrane protein (DUF2068 family)
MSGSDRTGRAGPLIAIAIFKLCKAVPLVAVAIGAQRLMQNDVRLTIERWARDVRTDPNDRLLHEVVSRLTGLTPQQMRAISLGLFLYAGLFATEGVGLLLRRRWAEYLTVISTALLLPLEIWEVIRRPHAMRWIVLVINLLIVIYLVMRLRRNSRHSQE